VEEKCTAAEEDQIFVRIGDQSDGAFLDRVIEEFGTPDIVIDDGSHFTQHINASFDHLYPKQPKNSVYLVEDTFCSYFSEEPAMGSGTSFLERTKGMIDLLHADHTRGRIDSNDFTDTTAAIHIYDGVVVFEKRGSNRRVAVTGNKQLFGEEIDNRKLAEKITELIYRSA